MQLAAAAVWATGTHLPFFALNFLSEAFPLPRQEKAAKAQREKDQRQKKDAFQFVRVPAGSVACAGEPCDKSDHDGPLTLNLASFGS